MWLDLRSLWERTELAIGPGSIDVQGQSLTNAINLPLTAGAISIDGQTVTMQLGTVVSLTAGTIDVSGQSITFALAVNPTVGSITVAGQSITSALGLPLTNGSVTVAGQSIAQSLGLPLTNGSVSVTGQSITLLLSGSISLDIDAPGSLSIQGQSITLTLTEQQAQANSGGFFYDIDHFRSRKRAERDRLERHESDTAHLEQMEREIAELLRDQERKDLERDELARIQRLADDYSGRNLGLPRRVSASLLKAYEERSRNALEQLQRELERMLEDEEITALMLILNDD